MEWDYPRKVVLVSSNTSYTYWEFTRHSPPVSLYPSFTQSFSCFYVTMRKALWVFDFSNKKYKSWCNWWITLNSIISECGSQCSHSGVWLCYTRPFSMLLVRCVTLTHSPSLHVLYKQLVPPWSYHSVFFDCKIMLVNRNGRNNYLEIFLWCNLPVSLAHGIEMKGLSLSWRSRTLTELGRMTPVASEDMISACGSSEWGKGLL